MLTFSIRPVMAILFGVGPCLATFLVCAQSIESQRYKSAQGIEIIQNRAVQSEAIDKPAVVIPAVVSSDKPRATSGKGNSSPPTTLAALSPTAAAPVSPPAERERSHVVSPKDQGLRDAGRLDILQQELSKEKVLHARALKTLQTPELKAKLSDEEGQRYAFMLGLHEQNISALTKEISRIPAAR